MISVTIQAVLLAGVVYLLVFLLLLPPPPPPYAEGVMPGNS